MSVYMNKYALESGVVQTPDNVGNDLEEIEKVIAGPDGIEAHRDEVEDAMEGVVGEPLEEVAMALYESEYNYNQLMRAVGINELACATSGQQFVLTEASFKGFFDNVKSIIKRMFATIVNAFRKAILKVTAMVSNDKKFADKHANDIRAGAKSTSWTFADYYAFKSIDSIPKFVSNADEYVNNAKASVDALKNGKEIDISSEEEYKNHIMYKYYGKKVEDIGDLILKIENDYKGEKSDIKGSHANLGEVVIEALKSDDGNVIKKAYDEIKDTYKKALDAIDKLEKDMLKDPSIIVDDQAANSKAFLVCNRASRCITFEQNMYNAVSKHIINLAKKKRNQARKLALVFINAAKEDANPNLKHESASFDNPFDAIKII